MPEPSAATLALGRAVVALEVQRAGIPAVTVPDPYDIRLTPESRKLLRRAKDDALAAVAARLAEIDPTGLDGGTISDAVAGLFRTDDGDGGTKESPVVVVTPAKGHADRFVVVLDFDLPCGVDSVLAVMRRSGPPAAVATELTVRNDDYASITEGRLGSDYSISPPRADGWYYLATANASPWCTSSWRGIHYLAVSPTADPKRPRIMAEYSGSARLDESVAALSAESDALRVLWSSWDELQGDVSRPHQHTWRLRGQDLSRTAPEVLRPQDVLAEWISSDEALAKGLVVEGAWAALGPKHKLWRRREPDAGTSIRIDGRDGVLDLDELPPHVVVELSCSACTKFPKKVDYEVERVDRSWRLRSLSTR